MANVVLGLFSPFRFSIRDYEGYDISKFRDNIRFLEMIVNRDGEMGGLCPLYFDGAVCDFKELPKPNTPELTKVYTYLQKKRAKTFFIHTINKIRKDLPKRNIFSTFASLFHSK